MGTDCSMILHDDRLRRLKTKEERINHIRSIEDFLVKKYGFANRDDAIVYEDLEYDEDMRFNFAPYSIVSINLIKDYWVIETGWRYHAYFADDNGPSGLPAYFYDIACDFGFEEAYICDEYLADEITELPFNDWIVKYGNIPELTKETKFGGYDGSFPRIFHESFQYEKELRTELSNKVAAIGYSANGISSVGWHFITVSRDNKIYLMNKESLILLIPTSVDYWMDLNGVAFEVVSEGKIILFACDGQKLFETDKGHFDWGWTDDKWNVGSIRVYNEESGQEVIVVTEALPTDKPDELCMYVTYYDANRNIVIPRIRL